MGVMLHLAFQTATVDKNGQRVLHGMPSPVDGTENTVWPVDFFWKYVPVFNRYGGTVAVLPPVTKGASLGTGYDPYNHYDLGSNLHGPAGRRETRYGSVEQIMEFVSRCRARGMQTYVNVVHHHLDGDNGNLQYDYIAGDGATPGRFPKDKNCFWIWSEKQPTNPDGVFDSSTDWGFGREFRWNSGTYGDGQGANVPGYVRHGLADSLDWQTKRLDIDGYFLDDAKGTNTAYIGWLLRQKSMAGKVAFAELSDGQTSTLSYFMNLPENNHRCGVIDFPLRYKIRNVCNYAADMHQILQEGVCWVSPMSAITFIENIDLDISDPVYARKELGYAMILAFPGYPMVFGKDMYDREDGGYGLGAPILNMVWTHETFAKGDCFVRAIGPDYLVIERMGDNTSSGAIWGFTTRNSWTRVFVQTKWQGQRLHDYHGQAEDKITHSDGMLDLWIPPDGNGAGRGHCCYAVPDVDNPIRMPPRHTTQTFFCAPDLDIPALKEGSNDLGWIIPAQGTSVTTSASDNVDVSVVDLMGNTAKIDGGECHIVATPVGAATISQVTVTYLGVR